MALEKLLEVLSGFGQYWPATHNVGLLGMDAPTIAFSANFGCNLFQAQQIKFTHILIAQTSGPMKPYACFVNRGQHGTRIFLGIRSRHHSAFNSSTMMLWFE